MYQPLIIQSSHAEGARMSIIWGVYKDKAFRNLKKVKEIGNSHFMKNVRDQYKFTFNPFSTYAGHSNPVFGQYK